MTLVRGDPNEVPFFLSDDNSQPHNAMSKADTSHHPTQATVGPDTTEFGCLNFSPKVSPIIEPAYPETSGLFLHGDQPPPRSAGFCYRYREARTTGSMSMIRYIHPFSAAD